MFKKIPFSPPYISEAAISEVVDTLRSGWITTGPKTKLFEKELTEYCGNKNTFCCSSATFGMLQALRWFGVGPGDEIIVPAYTYCATANVVRNLGAEVIMADICEDDFSIDVDHLEKLITPRTKAIIPVDLGGLPIDYDKLYSMLEKESVLSQFTPANDEQELLGRILVLTDAAHSLGATYKGVRSGAISDISVFSFHAVKNLTTAEGGAIAMNLPEPFDNDLIYRRLNTISLHGQTVDALAKTSVGGYKYDVVESGFKGNMTDIQSSLGLSQLREYDKILGRRKAIFEAYNQAFSSIENIITPLTIDEKRESSYHLYLLRIGGITDLTRDKIIADIFSEGVSVNVHYQPLPLLTAFKRFKIEEYPVSYKNYSREISMPVYYTLSDEDVERVIHVVKKAIIKFTNAEI